jgi:4-diphosphocytidyl-2-C-methyl-D-erythritol kinase
MVIFPISKINIGLRVLSKRNDGFHNIETIFYPVRLCDALELVTAEDGSNKDTITVTGINYYIKPDDNLVIKAINKLREKYDFPYLRIHLHKAIPSGAGLGGGSSDAVSIIKLINSHYMLSMSKQELTDTALSIGSDCPFFIDSCPSYATGKGEVLSEIKPVLSGLYLVLVKPPVAINTSEAYRNCNPRPSDQRLSDFAERPVDEWKELIYNDFERFAFSKHKVISDIKDCLYDSEALFSLMSGSGSCVYGIFRGKPTVSDFLRDMIVYEGII